MPNQYFINKVRRPYDIMNNKQDNIMVIVPAYQQSINA